MDGGQGTARQSEISSQQDQLDKEITILEEVISNLASRIDGVLRKEPPTKVNEACSEEALTTAIGNRIQGHTTRIRHISNCCKAMIDRCEL